MLIKKIEIENFRQYFGRQIIKFSTDKEKNVTLILGENGAGKTVISQAFLWCLYGETPAFNKKDALLSKIAEDNMEDGESSQVYVKIYMEHAQTCYEITRTLKYTKKDNKLIAGNPRLNIEAGGCILKEKVINEILPKELAQYFFLSGEKIDAMATDIKKGNSKDFAKAVNTLLDLDYIKSAIKHLTSLSKEYNSAAVLGLEEELTGINRDIKLSEENKDTFKQRLHELEKSEETHGDLILEYREKLRMNKSSHDIQIDIEKIEGKIDEKKNLLDQKYITGVQTFVNTMPYAILKGTIAKVNKSLDEIIKIPSEEIPESLHADLINWIEEHGKCICGREIKEHDEAYELLERWKNIVPPQAIGTIASNLREIMQLKESIGKGLKSTFRITNQDIEHYSDEIDELEDQLADKKEELETSSDMSDYQNALENAKKQLQLTRDLISKQKDEIARNNMILQELEAKRTDICNESDKGKMVLKFKDVTHNLIDMLSELLKEQEKNKRELLTNSVKEQFAKIYGTSFSITIDDNYHITTDNNLEKSTGQGMAVIISFLAGLLDVIKQDKQKNIFKEENIPLESYPLVFDAPFSALDTQRITSICKVLPSVAEQIIIFIKDTDGDLVKEEMKDKIGCYYYLSKVGNSDIETKIRSEE